MQKHVCLESNRGFATEKKILEFRYYPNKDFFFFKISYACISATSVEAVFCSFLSQAKIEIEGEGKPP